jgi:hypothetical protein
MYAVFIRVREPDGVLRDWHFDGFKNHVESGISVNMVLRTGGQFAAVNFYSGDIIFRASPVPIALFSETSPAPGKWELGLWQVSATDHRLVWGLLYNGETTMMCYEYNSTSGVDVLARKGDNWVFHVGSDLKVKISDLEKAFQMLGI